MTYKNAKGRITFLRAQKPKAGFGPAGDNIDAEVIVALDSHSEKAYGFQLRADDPNLPSRLAMFALLRDAYIHNLEVYVAYNDIKDKDRLYLEFVQFQK